MLRITGEKVTGLLHDSAACGYRQPQMPFHLHQGIEFDTAFMRKGVTVPIRFSSPDSHPEPLHRHQPLYMPSLNTTGD